MLYNAINYANREFLLQWHLTSRCDMRCSHCYIPHDKKDFTSDFNDLAKGKSILDQLSELCADWGVSPRVNFSGGNPLFSVLFWPLAEYASSLGIRIGILGNPSSLLDEDILGRLSKLPVFRYQISLDGLEQTHDLIRGGGAFSCAIKGIKALTSKGIPAVILSTVTSGNMDEIREVAKYAFDLGVTVFDFARVVPCGEAANDDNLLPSPEAYRSFLLSMYELYREVQADDPTVHIGSKDPLWMLLHNELGTLKPKPIGVKDKIYGGCSIGINGLSVDTDLTVYSCRRLEIPIGNLQSDSLYDCFINSEELNRQRRTDIIDGCSDCNLLSVCRGCRAVAYAVHGDYFAKDPSCWKCK